MIFSRHIGNKNCVMSNSYSCCIFDALKFKTNRKNSNHNTLELELWLTTYVLIVFTGKKSYVNCLPIAFNF